MADSIAQFETSWSFTLSSDSWSLHSSTTSREPRSPCPSCIESRPPESCACLALTFSCAYYWGICGFLIGLTLYRPANGAIALTNSVLNSSSWLTFWTVFWGVSLAVSSLRIFMLKNVDQRVP